MTEVKKTADDIFYEVYDKYIADLHNQKSPKESFRKAMHEYSQQVNAELLDLLHDVMISHVLREDIQNKIFAAIKRARGL